MSIQTRKYTKTHSFEWNDSRLSLEFRSESSMRPFSSEYRIGRASFDFVLQLPNREANPNPSSRSKWFERLRAYANLESTKAWRGICDLLDGAGQLPPDARDFVRRVVRAEATDAYEKTVLIKHFVMSMTVIVRVMPTNWELEDSNDDLGITLSEIRWRLRLRRRPRDNCGLCGEGLLTREVGLECEHSFHLDCYNSWRRRSDQCPACGPQVQ